MAIQASTVSNSCRASVISSNPGARPQVSHLLDGEQPPPWRSLGATFEPISLAAARRLGVEDELIDHASDGWSDSGLSILCVGHASSSEAGRDLAAPTPELGADCLKGGDLLLSIDDVAIRSLHDAEAALQGKESVTVRVLREGVLRMQRCATVAHDGLGTQQVGRLVISSPPYSHPLPPPTIPHRLSIALSCDHIAADRLWVGPGCCCKSRPTLSASSARCRRRAASMHLTGSLARPRHVTT